MAQASNYRNRVTVVGQVQSVEPVTLQTKDGGEFSFLDVRVRQDGSNLPVRVMASKKDPLAMQRFQDNHRIGSWVRINGILQEREYTNKQNVVMKIRDISTWGGFTEPTEEEKSKFKRPFAVIRGDVVGVFAGSDFMGLTLECLEGANGEYKKQFTFVARGAAMQQVAGLAQGTNVEVSAYIVNRVITDEFDTIIDVVNELEVAKVVIKGNALMGVPNMAGALTANTSLTQSAPQTVPQIPNGGYVPPIQVPAPPVQNPALAQQQSQVVQVPQPVQPVQSVQPTQPAQQSKPMQAW